MRVTIETRAVLRGSSFHFVGEPGIDHYMVSSGCMNDNLFDSLGQKRKMLRKVGTFFILSACRKDVRTSRTPSYAAVMEHIKSYTTPKHEDPGMTELIKLLMAQAPLSMNEAAIRVRAEQLVTLYETLLLPMKERREAK